MNYQKIYDALIQKRKQFPANKEFNYSETHHIIPKSIDRNKEKDPNNLVSLSARKHFIAHVLLVKIYEKQQNKEKYFKSILAINLMINKNSKRKEWNKLKLNSKKYEFLRIKAANINSIIAKKWMKENKEKISGKNNSSYGTIWIKNLLTNENKKIKKGKSIPEGWIKGRFVPDYIKKNLDISRNIKRMWIRKKDLSEQKFVLINTEIPEGWERGSILKLTEEQKQKISNRSHFPKEYYDEMKKFLLPIYKEYKLHPSKETYLYLQQKFNLQKWSWNNFLGKCKKYLN